jgi:uncharacterized protein (DUF488 family)
LAFNSSLTFVLFPAPEEIPSSIEMSFRQRWRVFRLGMSTWGHLGALGGLRPKRDISAAVNGFWQNQSFHNYADYAMTEEFRAALGRLRNLGHQSPTAIMCAEAVWWQCHPRIIADYLMAADEIVFHIMGGGRVEPAEMTKGAKCESDGILTYPALL